MAFVRDDRTDSRVDGTRGYVQPRLQCVVKGMTGSDRSGERDSLFPRCDGQEQSV